MFILTYNVEISEKIHFYYVYRQESLACFLSTIIWRAILKYLITITFVRLRRQNAGNRTSFQGKWDAYKHLILKFHYLTHFSFAYFLNVRVLILWPSLLKQWRKSPKKKSKRSADACYWERSHCKKIKFLKT